MLMESDKDPFSLRSDLGDIGLLSDLELLGDLNELTLLELFRVRLSSSCTNAVWVSIAIVPVANTDSRQNRTSRIASSLYIVSEFNLKF